MYEIWGNDSQKNAANQGLKCWKIRLDPRKLTWIPKMMVWKRWFLLNMAFFGIYVKFLGGSGSCSLRILLTLGLFSPVFPTRTCSEVTQSENHVFFGFPCSTSVKIQSNNKCYVYIAFCHLSVTHTSYIFGGGSSKLFY